MKMSVKSSLEVELWSHRLNIHTTNNRAHQTPFSNQLLPVRAPSIPSRSSATVQIQSISKNTELIPTGCSVEKCKCIGLFSCSGVALIQKCSFFHKILNRIWDPIREERGSDLEWINQNQSAKRLFLLSRAISFITVGYIHQPVIVLLVNNL